MNSREAVLKPFENKRLAMEDRIRSGIEENRKGDFTLSFPGIRTPVKVRAIQKKHDFALGANIFMLKEFESEEKNSLYEKFFAETFQLATLPFYWKDIEPERGKLRFEKTSPKIYRRPPPDLCLEFCTKHGITPKAHCLNYSWHIPEWVPNNAKEEKELLEKRFRELAERYAGKIPMWEVTNETFYSWNLFRDRSAFFHEKDLIEWSFKTAEKYFPCNTLVINEMQERIWNRESFYEDRSLYYMQIERALAKGAKIDGIGMQFHMFHRREKEAEMTADYYDPERIFAVLDTYAAFGKNLQITEMTIPAYSDEKEDEEIQAEIIRNLYRIFFSHPAMAAVVYWNLVDGYAASASRGDMTSGENYYRGGLFRFDMTPKKSYETIRDLFAKEYHTEEELFTPDGSDVSFRGFFGTYILEIETEGKIRKIQTDFLRNSDQKRSIVLS